MVTLVGFLKRPPDVPREEFQRWWVEKHVPQVMRVPGIRRYVVHVVRKGFNPLALPAGEFNDDPEFEGVAELWFDDEETAMRAWSTREGVEDLAHFAKYIGKVAVVLADPKVMIPGPQEPFPTA